MKVGVLTFHGSINPGAFWQTYATCQLLQSMGHEVEVIDYYHAYRHQRGIMQSAGRLRAWLRPDLLARNWVQRYYAERSRGELPLSRRVDRADDLTKLVYDAIIVGSDVVWESPIDPVFLGAGLHTEILVAYAASAGRSQAAEGDIPAQFKSVTPFNRIAVRDENTLQLLHRGDPSWSKDVSVISDPTITLQVPEACFRRRHRKPYVMLYCSRRIPAEFKRQINDYAHARGLEVFAVFYRQRGFRSVSRITAFDWMSYLVNADAVVTDTFHGSVLSCLSNRPLAVVNLSENTWLKSKEQFTALGILPHRCQSPSDIPELLSKTWSPQDASGRAALDGVNRSYLAEALT